MKHPVLLTMLACLFISIIINTHNYVISGGDTDVEDEKISIAGACPDDVIPAKQLQFRFWLVQYYPCKRKRKRRRTGRPINLQAAIKAESLKSVSLSEWFWQKFLYELFILKLRSSLLTSI